MYNTIVGNLSDWLNKKFLEWQNQKGRPQKAKAFAEHLDVKYTTYSGWVNSKIPPSKENVEKLAAKLGPEIYDILGMLRPDPDEEKWLSVFRAVPPGNKKALMDLAVRFLLECGGSVK